MADSVCTTCNDTHIMVMGEGGYDEREVMCTRCPVPCQKCRAGGNGAFCERTPCSCACHAPKCTRSLEKTAEELADAAKIYACFGPHTAPETKARLVELCREYIAGLEEVGHGCG